MGSDLYFCMTQDYASQLSLQRVPAGQYEVAWGVGSSFLASTRGTIRHGRG